MIVTAEGANFILDFGRDPDIAREVTRLPGRRFDPARTVWTVPVIYGDPVKALAARHGATIADTAEHHIRPRPGATIDHDGERYEVRFPFSEQALEDISQIDGAHYDGPRETWTVPEGREEQLRAFEQQHRGEHTGRAADAYTRADAFDGIVQASGAMQSDYQLKPGFGLELDPHQRAAVEYAMKYAGGHMVIGDEPGVGKTAEAMAILHERDAFPAVIVPPSKAKINWAREIQEALPGRSVEILNGTKGQDRLMWADVTIMNYEIIRPWMKYLPALRGVVSDESHNIMNPRAQRTKAVIELGERVPASGVRVCMTGTPSLNRADEFIPQIKAVGQMDALGGEKDFKELSRRDPAQANRLLRGTCYIRRTKKDVWPDGPKRQFTPLIVEGDPKIMAEYRRAEASITRYLGDKAKRAAEASGATTEEARNEAWKAAVQASAAEQLVAVNHLRQLSAQAKMPAAIQWSKDMIASGQKLGVFGWHRPVIDEYADKLKAPKIQGGQSDAASQRAIDLFQTDDDTRTIALQMKAAGVAITLTAGSNALFIEQGWNPGTMDQCLDRFHRRGQVNDVTGWVMMIEGTIDESMDQIIGDKRKHVGAITDGGALEEDGGTVLTELVTALAAKGMNAS